MNQDLSKQEYTEALLRLCESNEFPQTVKLLLANGADPSYSNNRAIRYACREGRLELVKILLRDQRVDPTEYNNEAFYEACQNGHTVT